MARKYFFAKNSGEFNLFYADSAARTKIISADAETPDDLDAFIADHAMCEYLVEVTPKQAKALADDLEMFVHPTIWRDDHGFLELGDNTDEYLLSDPRYELKGRVWERKLKYYNIYEQNINDEHGNPYLLALYKRADGVFGVGYNPNLAVDSFIGLVYTYDTLKEAREIIKNGFASNDIRSCVWSR